MATNTPPGLLVSVRDAVEAEVAVDAGAALIDVKEPRRGALGAADRETIERVVEAVAGRLPVSVALGELLEEAAAIEPAGVPAGVNFAKVGLSGCAAVADWQARLATLVTALPRDVQSVAVIYADWKAAAAPAPDEVLSAAADLDCAAVLIDTFDKSSGNLFAHWSVDQLAEVVDAIRSVAPLSVVAGALDIESLDRALASGADYVAVRGAACLNGRSGTVDGDCVRQLVESLARPIALYKEIS